MTRILVTILYLAAMFSVCCMAVPKNVTAPAAMVYQPRSPMQQSATSIELISLCVSLADKDPWGKDFTINTKHGTGVIVDRRHIITAHHVVGCELGAYVAVMADGRAVPLVVDKSDTSADLSRLMVADGATFDVKDDVEVGRRPALNDSVCANSVIPERKNNCGKVISTYPWSRVGITYNAPTVGGNSGSPVYNSEGKLIGIVVARYPCEEVTKEEAGCGLAVWLDDHMDFVHPR